MKKQIEDLKKLFQAYILLIKDLENIEKAEMNDFCMMEEQLRKDIIKELTELKENYF